MKINFVNLTEEITKKYNKLIKKIFKQVKDKKIFNIIFVTEEEIQRLNKEYRQIDRVTDVLSFALNDNEELNSLMNNELGDVFICLNKAYGQAKDYDHSVEREIGFLAVHGYLHLCGYDHQNEADERLMLFKQEEMLTKVKLKRGI